ncbi:unnamed protein product [Lactuca saligna]|uniref:Uncharacterized protein n=1 Tax=Lactuca saligna TaxID=75948 RepID=A0AA36DY04_LACSI|nr:unnamed protein product [Lactuca saligna]
MSSSAPKPDGLHPIVELNFKGVFLRNPFSYNHGINPIFNDHDFSGMTYGECITFFKRFMQESIKKLYYCKPGKPLMFGIISVAKDEDYGGFIFQAYGTDGKLYMYVDHDGQGIEDWFGSEIEKEDGDDSCFDGGENEDEIDNLTDLDVDFNEDIVTTNRTKGDEFLNRLCGKEEEGNDNNIDDDDDGREEDANVTQKHSIFNEFVPWKKQFPILGMRFKDPTQLNLMLCNYVVANGYQLGFEKNDRKILLVKCCKGVAETLKEDDEGNQVNAMNEGNEVNGGEQAVNDDGGVVNDGGEAVNEVHMQQDYDEVELIPFEFDASGNGEPSQVHVQEHEARETPGATLFKKIKRKRSERIIKLKLGKKVGGADAPGNSEAKHVTLE